MKRAVILVSLLFAPLLAMADGSGSGSGSAAGSGSGSGQAYMPQVPAEPPVPAPAAPSDARKACTAAMNADPTFATAIVVAADKQAAEKRDQDTVKRNLDTAASIAQNERHVILAYAAMWIIAAGFVIFLWRRQQGLKLEIGNLKADLERALASEKEERPGAPKR